METLAFGFVLFLAFVAVGVTLLIVFGVLGFVFIKLNDYPKWSLAGAALALSGIPLGGIWGGVAVACGLTCLFVVLLLA